MGTGSNGRERDRISPTKHAEIPRGTDEGPPSDVSPPPSGTEPASRHRRPTKQAPTTPTAHTARKDEDYDDRHEGREHGADDEYSVHTWLGRARPAADTPPDAHTLADDERVPSARESWIEGRRFDRDDG